MKDRDSVRLEWNGRKREYSLQKKIPHQHLDKIYPCLSRGDESLFENGTRQRLPIAPESSGRFFLGDNLQVINYLLESGFRQKIDLIYLDPPYLSSAHYSSNIPIGYGGAGEKRIIKRPVFKDGGLESIEAYLEAIYPRLKGAKELLTPAGNLFVHLDWHVSHYVKILLDEIFSRENFINEIVWCYGGGSGSKRHFHRKHDLILWYSRGEDYIFNPQYRPYSPGTMERGLTRVKGSKYHLHQQGALMQDWWADINKILSPTAGENLKFPTQKPEALLKRIVAAASNPNSLVADFYAGSGTTASVCEQMGRRWIMGDESCISAYTTIARLIRQHSNPFDLETVGENITSSRENQLLLKPPILQKYQERSVLLLLGIEDYHTKTPPEAEQWKGPCLIDFWAVDLDYDGKVFTADVQVMRGRVRFDDQLAMDIKVNLPVQNNYCIAVKVYDIFGGSAMTVVNL